MIKGINHVGVIVKDLDQSLKQYDKLLKLRATTVMEGLNGKVRVAFVHVGDDEIELIQPLDLETPLGKFLQTHGPGIHHISLTTDNIDGEVDRMRKEGVVFDQQEPRVGVHGVRIIFTKPETTDQLTVELCEELRDKPA